VWVKTSFRGEGQGEGDFPRKISLLKKSPPLEGREREKGGEFWFFKISSLFLQLIRVKIDAATSLIH